MEHSRHHKYLNPSGLYWAALGAEGGGDYFPYHVLRNKASVLDLIGQWDQAQRIRVEILEQTKKGGAIALAAEASRDLGALLLKRGDSDAAWPYLQKARDIYCGQGDGKGTCTVLNQMASYYETKSDYPRALEVLETQLKLAEELGDKTEISSALNDIGIWHWRKGERQKAMEYYHRRISICRELNDEMNLGKTYANIGIICFDEGRYQEALEHYRRDIEISKKFGNKKGWAVSIGNLGMVYHLQGNYARAMQCYQEKLRISLEMGDRAGLSMLLCNIGVLHYYQGQLKEAMDYHRRDLALSREMGSSSGEARALANMASIHIEDQDYQAARECYDKAINTARELGIKRYLCEMLYGRAGLFLLLEMHAEAEADNSEALIVAGKINQAQTLFNSRVQKAMIVGRRDPEQGVGILQELAGACSDAEPRASISYALYKITGRSEQGKQALERYTDLVSRTPNIEFNKRIDELNEIFGNS
ncbi:MAG: tetratricopeptide repeat protein [Candidatus Edwardsbacteria bacterium]|nr:tetratricopeptide repeat protein [Candidatus Edwardsbacteria bacterium]